MAANGNHLEEALSEAQGAVALAPDAPQAQAELGDILLRLHRPDESRLAFHKALEAAETIHPEFRSTWLLAQIRSGLAAR